MIINNQSPHSLINAMKIIIVITKGGNQNKCKIVRSKNLNEKQKKNCHFENQTNQHQIERKNQDFLRESRNFTVRKYKF